MYGHLLERRPDLEAVFGARGATVAQAYPVDRRERSRDDAMWLGVKSMFDGAGCVEVARRKPQRPVVRHALG